LAGKDKTMGKNTPPGKKLYKGIGLKNKWRISISASFIIIGLGLLFFCESFYRLKSNQDQTTWNFFLFVSALILFLGLYLFSSALGYKNTLKLKKILKKSRLKNQRDLLGTDKLEIQKNPRREG
jgi:sulfite exporter TauE/SafE